MQGGGLAPVLQQADDVVALFEAKSSQRIGQRADLVEPDRVGEAHLAVDDREGVRVTGNTGEEGAA
jgi:hypothetical protein